MYYENFDLSCGIENYHTIPDHTRDLRKFRVFFILSWLASRRLKILLGLNSSIGGCITF